MMGNRNTELDSCNLLLPHELCVLSKAKNTQNAKDNSETVIIFGGCSKAEIMYLLPKLLLG
jgi:hypothetical protein